MSIDDELKLLLNSYAGTYLSESPIMHEIRENTLQEIKALFKPGVCADCNSFQLIDSSVEFYCKDIETIICESPHSYYCASFEPKEQLSPVRQAMNNEIDYMNNPDKQGD